MERIWRYELAAFDPSSVIMPEGARILSVGEQDGRLCVWARVEPGARLVQRWLRVTGTGWECDVPAEARFIGTVQMRSGMVYHVFECGGPPSLEEDECSDPE